MKTEKGIVAQMEGKDIYVPGSTSFDTMKEIIEQMAFRTPPKEPWICVGIDFFQGMNDDEFKGMIKSDITFQITQNTLDYINQRKADLGIK